MLTKFNDLYINAAKDKQVPVHIFRYEDLVSNPQKTLEGIFCFMLGVPSVEGTVLQKRIKDVVGKGAGVSQVYKPKNNKLNSNAHRFNEELMVYMKETLKD